jgi:hypothetical protein
MYNDDRMFVLYVCPCTLESIPAEGVTKVTLHHEERPEGHRWAVATFRNVPRYPIHRVDEFQTFEEAENHRREIEPRVPLASLGGQSMPVVLSYEEWERWKQIRGMREFNHRTVFTDGVASPRDVILRRDP